MSFPQLSVIITNYNHARYLPTCLQAVLDQSVQPHEIIVIDDASTDHSVEVIDGFARRHPLIRFYRNKENQGVVWGMNRGLDLARGDYIYYAAADDQILPGFFEKSLGLLRQYPQAALSCTIGDWWEVATGLNWHVAVSMTESAGFIAPAEMVRLEREGKLYIASHAAIMRREAILEADKFLPEFKWFCDWFAIYVAGFRHGICFVPEPLAQFNIHRASYYKSGARTPRAHRDVLQKMLDRLNQKELQDVEPLIRESGALFIFGLPVLQVLLRQTAYRRYLTPAFLWKNLWHITKLQLKKATPSFLGNWYFRISGYRARAPVPPA